MYLGLLLNHRNSHPTTNVSQLNSESDCNKCDSHLSGYNDRNSDKPHPQASTQILNKISSLVQYHQHHWYYQNT